jgi:N-formylglutamate amidohydrolase
MLGEIQIMAINFIHRKYLKYYLGDGVLYCHLDAVHAASPRADVFTDKIVREVIKRIGCAGIIGTVSRTQVDLNRPPSTTYSREAAQEYRSSLKEILNHLGIVDKQKHILTRPYFHLGIHGMKNATFGPYAIEIGTRNGKSCSMGMRDCFEELFRKNALRILPQIELVVDQRFIGDRSITFHRHGDDMDYKGYGEHYHAFQIEIARTLRENYREEVIELLCNVIHDFQKQFIHEV